MNTPNHTHALKNNGELWGWGGNASYQLGDQTTSDRSSPVLVVGGHSFIAVSNGEVHAMALKADGSVWCWGDNNESQLGNNDPERAPSSTPVAVVGNHSFVKIAAGSLRSWGLKANGELWGWGDGSSYGSLGNNDMVDHSSPVLVVGNHSFIDVRGGEYSTIALKENGQVWAWGWNNAGQLGDGTLIDRSSPVLVVGNHSFIKIAYGKTHGLGLKADGSVWAWGVNSFGELGDNTRTNRTSPVLVVGNHSFVSIDAGGSVSGSMSAALKANGEMWTWGHNGWGQLGQNTRTSRSSPVLVVGNHSFAEIRVGDSYMHGLKANNGQVWGWGRNVSGRIGDNTITSRSSPVLVVGNHSFISLWAYAPASSVLSISVFDRMGQSEALD